MGKVISLYCHKGGTAKTTSIASIASAMVLDRKRVLLIDLDAQCNLTSMLVERERVAEAKDGTIFDALTSGGKNVSIERIRWGLDMIVGDERMSAWPDLVAKEMRREDFLKNVLAQYKRVYDYILVDCPGHFDITLINALTAANMVLVPAGCDEFSLQGLTQAVEHIEMIQARTNKSLRLLGIFITLYDGRQKLAQAVEEVITKFFPNKVLTTKIRRCADVAKAPIYRKDVITYRPKCAGAVDYLALYEEIKPLLER